MSGDEKPRGYVPAVLCICRRYADHNGKQAMQSLLVVLAVALSADDPAITARDAAIDGILKWMQTYREFPQISIWCDFDYECLHGNSDYAWSHVQIETRRQGEKLRTVPILTDRNTGKLERRDTTWDGKVSMTRSATNAEIPRDITIGSQLHTWTLTYRFYDNYIFSPDARARQQELQMNLRVAKSNYWLPAALENNRVDFKLLSDTELVDGRKCLVLSRGEQDRFWIDPSLGHAVCRREVRRKAADDRGEVAPDDYLERTTMSEFKEIDGLWMPHKVVREVLIVGEQMKELVVRDRRTIKVKLISTSPFDDSEFQLPIPAGVTVYDNVNQQIYVK
jgi:hypothetical protein